MEKSLKELKNELRFEPVTPRQKVCDDMSERLTAGQDTVMSMRIELFLMSLVGITESAIVEVARGGLAKSDVELLTEIKDSDGYHTLDTDMVIPDRTVILLINEAKVRLANAYSSPVNPAE